MGLQIKEHSNTEELKQLRVTQDVLNMKLKVLKEIQKDYLKALDDLENPFNIYLKGLKERYENRK